MHLSLVYREFSLFLAGPQGSPVQHECPSLSSWEMKLQDWSSQALAFPHWPSPYCIIGGARVFTPYTVDVLQSTVFSEALSVFTGVSLHWQQLIRHLSHSKGIFCSWTLLKSSELNGQTMFSIQTIRTESSAVLLFSSILLKTKLINQNILLSRTFCVPVQCKWKWNLY